MAAPRPLLDTAKVVLTKHSAHAAQVRGVTRDCASLVPNYANSAFF